MKKHANENTLFVQQINRKAQENFWALLIGEKLRFSAGAILVCRFGQQLLTDAWAKLQTAHNEAKTKEKKYIHE